ERLEPAQAGPDPGLRRPERDALTVGDLRRGAAAEHGEDDSARLVGERAWSRRSARSVSTRCRAVSARSGSGPRVSRTSWSSTGPSVGVLRRARTVSIAVLRVIVRIQVSTEARRTSYVSAARHTRRNTSWLTSSAARGSRVMLT